MKKYLRIFYLSSIQINFLIKVSAFLSNKSIIGKGMSVFLDNLLLYFFGMEVVSRSIAVSTLIVGHSTGVVLGGNGIRCTGTLHVSSGVVFARRYGGSEESSINSSEPMFVIDGDITVGANSVLLGPLSIKGPVIVGALSLVAHDITEPGVYVGSPARKIRDI